MSAAIGARRIVVGVDGSASSRAALRWALRHATAVGARVVAVQVRRPTPSGDRSAEPDRLHWAVRSARFGVPGAPPVEESHVDGLPDVELVEAARDADLLVLGRRPHGRVTELVLGDTAADCVRRARCPVVLVPAV